VPKRGGGFVHEHKRVSSELSWTESQELFDGRENEANDFT
jgi:hypothetical protein